MKIPHLMTVCLTTLLAAGSVFAGSRNSENLLGPTGMVGQPGNKGITSRDFNNNGMSGSAALCMSFHGNRESAAFFSRCFAAAHDQLMDHKRQNTRADGIRMLAAMPLEDFQRVADRLQYVIKDQDLTYHSYHNPTQAIGGMIKAIKEDKKPAKLITIDEAKASNHTNP